MKFLIFFIMFGCISKAYSGEKITVMVIDSGIDASHTLLKDYIDYDRSSNYVDSLGHGSHVTGIILYGNHMYESDGVVLGKDPLCSRVRIISCKNVGPYVDSLKVEINCINEATRLKIDYINVSEGGPEYSKEEYDSFKKYVNGGGTVFVAAGNTKTNLEHGTYYPASYSFGPKKLKNFYVVENILNTGELESHSNWHHSALRALGTNILSTLPNSKYGYMTGTSQALPSYLHTVLKHRCESKF